MSLFEPTHTENMDRVKQKEAKSRDKGEVEEDLECLVIRIEISRAQRTAILDVSARWLIVAHRVGREPILIDKT
jgi:hypothetical protein